VELAKQAVNTDMEVLVCMGGAPLSQDGALRLPSKGSKRTTLENLKPIVYAIAETIGRNCEVLLHDLSDPEHSIIAIANGHITGRQEGDSITDLALKYIRKGPKEGDRLVNYATKSPDGRPLKSTTVFIRDEDGEIIGLLCINLDISQASVAKAFLEDLTQVTNLEHPNEESSPETFASDISQLLRAAIDRAIEDIGKPPSFMGREDKLRVVGSLDEKGIFLIKGAVDEVAEALGVSRYSIYNYLDEVRAKEARVPNF